MNEAPKKSDNKPVKTIRQGAIGVSIWRRQTQTGMEYFDFSISRSWKTKSSGKEGYSPNFFSSNEAELTQVVRDAAAWIACQHVGSLAYQAGSDLADNLNDRDDDNGDDDENEVYSPRL